MELRLLGSLEVWVDGEVRPVPVRAERALLAMLALSPSRVVPTATLVDALWPSADSAQDPVNALQLRVSRLRRTLAAIGAPARLPRDGAGYRLMVDAQAVDLHRFVSLVEAARRTEAPDLALSRYDEALRLWRGEPLVEFAGEAWAAVEAARLTELRLCAVAERAERMLALGRYDEAVADLEPVASADPTRERLVGQLMVALCGAGRQAEALAAFARTRQALADELGLDPSAELRAVAERVLRQDPTLSSSQAGRPGPGAGDRAPVGNLPLRATSFVGRDADVARTLNALSGARLVTLAGPGGAGKTSLAVEVARAAAVRFTGGAWLVRLAAVGDGELLAHTVADALGVSVAGSASDPEDALVGHLATRNLLLLLDNCEHLIEAVASFAETVLGRCAGVRILATSREALAVPGEVQLPVAPLPVPDDLTPAERVTDFAAARLFLDRAAAATPDLVFDDAALAAVGVICQRLDGIPLALELAAARLASLSPRELAERVHDRFGMLTSGSRTAEARQRTLRNAVDWSHDLLAPAEKVLLRRLAVFRGGWTLAAAEDVVADDALPGAAVLDVLERLVKQSLVIADRAGGATRYRMLETLRQYAAERLRAAGESDVLAAAHAAHYLQLGERAEVGLRGREQERWLAMLREEHANLRAALAWFGSVPGQVDGALRLAGSLGLYWHLGRHLEGRETLERVTALPGGSPEARARALQAVSLAERPTACIVHPSPRCAAAASASLEIFEQVDDKPRAAFSRLLLAVEGVAASPHVDAGALLEEASRQFTALGDDWGLAVVAFVRMEILAKRGDEASMRRAAEEAVARFQALSDGWGLSAVLYHLGWGLQRFNRLADAVPVLEKAIEVAARAGVYNTEQWATADLGLVMLLLGREEEASAWFARAGDVSDQVGDRAGRVFATYGRAVLAQRRGEHRAALTLYQEALRGLERLGIGLGSGLAVAGVGQCEEALGNTAAARAAYQRALALGQGAGEVGLTAGALEGLARGRLADGDPVGAAELLGRARWLRQTYHRPATDAESAAVDVATAATRAALDDQEFAAASRAGAALGLRGAG